MFNLLAATFGTVSEIEILWCLLGAIGMVLAYSNFKEARADRWALKKRGIENGRYDIAWNSEVQDGIRLIIHTIFVTIGVLSATIPEIDTDQPWNVIAVRTVVVWGLIFSSFLLIVKSWLARQLRMKILKDERHAVKNEMDAQKLLDQR